MGGGVEVWGGGGFSRQVRGGGIHYTGQIGIGQIVVGTSGV